MTAGEPRVAAEAAALAAVAPSPFAIDWALGEDDVELLGCISDPWERAKVASALGAADAAGSEAQKCWHLLREALEQNVAYEELAGRWTALNKAVAHARFAWGVYYCTRDDAQSGRHQESRSA